MWGWIRWFWKKHYEKHPVITVVVIVVVLLASSAIPYFWNSTFRSANRQAQTTSSAAASGDNSIAISGNGNSISVARRINQEARKEGGKDGLQNAADKSNLKPSKGHEYTNSDITALAGGTGVKLTGSAPVKFDHDRIIADGRAAHGRATVGVDDNSIGRTTMSNDYIEADRDPGSRHKAVAVALLGPSSNLHGIAGVIVRSPSPRECRPSVCLDIHGSVSKMTLPELRQYGKSINALYTRLHKKCYANEVRKIYRDEALPQYASVQRRIQSLIPDAPIENCLQATPSKECSWKVASQQMTDLMNALPSR